MLEKSVEKKVTGKKRFSKSDEVDRGATAVTTVGIPEKRQKAVFFFCNLWMGIQVELFDVVMTMWL